MKGFENTLWFLHVSGFFRKYVLSRKTGIMGIRLCTLNNLHIDPIKTDEQFKLFINWLNACMPDAPYLGYDICVWTYEKCSICTHVSSGVPDEKGAICTHVSRGDPNLAVVPKDGSVPKPTIHEDIARHLCSMADGNPIIAFEVSFYDLKPEHKWFFISE